MPMRKIISLAVVFCCLVCVVNAEGLKHKIARVNKEVAAAIKRKDLAAFERIVRANTTSDFQYSENGQKMGFDQMLGEMKQSFGMMKRVIVAKAVSSHIAVHGDMATSSTSHHIVATMAGPDHKTHRMDMAGVSADTYKKEGGAWKLASMTWGAQTMKMDGKKINPQQMMQGGAGGGG